MYYPSKWFIVISKGGPMIDNIITFATDWSFVLVPVVVISYLLYNYYKLVDYGKVFQRVEQKEEMEEVEETVSSSDDEVAKSSDDVFASKGSKIYHKAGCRHLAKVSYPVKVTDALIDMVNMRPCKTCHID